MSNPPPPPPPIAGSDDRKEKVIKNLMTDWLGESFAPTVDARGLRAWQDMTFVHMVESPTTVPDYFRAMCSMPAGFEAVQAQAFQTAETALKSRLLEYQAACYRIYMQGKQPRQMAKTDSNWANWSQTLFHDLINEVINGIVLPLFCKAKAAALEAIGASPADVLAAVVFAKQIASYVMDGAKALPKGPKITVHSVPLAIVMRTSDGVAPVKGTRPPGTKSYDGVYVNVDLRTHRGISSAPLAAVRSEPDNETTCLCENEMYDQSRPFSPECQGFSSVAALELQNSAEVRCCHHGAIPENDIGFPHVDAAVRKIVPNRLRALHEVDATTGSSIVSNAVSVNVQLCFGTGAGKPAAMRIATAAVCIAHLSSQGLTLRSLIDAVLFAAGPTAMSAKGSLSPQNSSQMIHFAWHHTLRYLCVAKVVVPADDADAERVWLYNKALVQQIVRSKTKKPKQNPLAALCTEYFKTRPHHKPTQSAHHHGMAILNNIAEAGLPMRINPERFGADVKRSVAVYDVVDAIEDLAWEHDPDGTARRGLKFADRLDEIRRLPTYTRVYELLLPLEFSPVEALHLWSQYQKAVRNHLLALKAPSTIIEVAKAALPVGFADPVWSEFAAQTDTHPGLFMVAWAAADLGLLSGCKTTQFTLESRRPPTHRAMILPNTTYVALCIPEDVKALAAVGMIQTTVSVAINLEYSLWLNELDPREFTPWPNCSNLPKELVTSAIATATRGLLFSEKVAAQPDPSSLFAINSMLLQNTVGRLPFPHPVATEVSDSPTRVQMPAWVFNGMVWKYLEATRESCTGLLAIPVPYIDDCGKAAVVMVYLATPGNNMKKARVYYRPPESIDCLAGLEPKVIAYDMFFQTGQTRPITNVEVGYTSASTKHPMPADRDASPIAARLASLPGIEHDIDIVTGILALAHADGCCKVLTILVDLIARDCSRRYGVDLTPDGAIEGWYRLREIWHVAFGFPSYSLRMTRLYSSPDKTVIRRLHNVNYRLEQTIVTTKEELCLQKAQQFAIANAAKQRSLLNQIRQASEKRQRYYSEIDDESGGAANKRKALMNLIADDAKLAKQLAESVDDVDAHVSEMRTMAASASTVGNNGATQVVEPPIDLRPPWT